MIRRKNKEKQQKRPLIKLTLIVIPTIAIVITTLIMLQANGFFMSTQDKLLGSFTRERNGEYSGEQYTETYTFNNDGTGNKTYITPDGKVSNNDFSWYVTPKNILVINGHVKYQYKANLEEYYSSSSKTTKKYWCVTKDNLYIGDNTSITYEEYTRN